MRLLTLLSGLLTGLPSSRSHDRVYDRSTAPILPQTPVVIEHGVSVGAEQRRARRRQRTGKLHQGKPGDTIKMSDRTYRVAKDGSFRRLY